MQDLASQVQSLQASLAQALKLADEERSDKAQRVRALREEVECVRTAATDESERRCERCRRRRERVAAARASAQLCRLTSLHARAERELWSASWRR